MAIEAAELRGPALVSSGIPGLVVDKTSGPCTVQLKGGGTCTAIALIMVVFLLETSIQLSGTS